MKRPSAVHTAPIAVALLFAPVVARAQTQATMGRQFVRAYVDAQDVSGLRTGETVSLLSAVLLVAPEEYPQIVRRSTMSERLMRRDSRQCAAALTTFGRIIGVPPSIESQKELQEIAGQNGFDPSIAWDIVRDHREVAALANELAAEARMSGALAAGQALDSAGRAVIEARTELIEMARNAMGDDPISLVAGRRTWPAMIDQRIQQTRVITSVICP